jgi:hypothetical protein
MTSITTTQMAKQFRPETGRRGSFQPLSRGACTVWRLFRPTTAGKTGADWQAFSVPFFYPSLPSSRLTITLSGHADSSISMKRFDLSISCTLLICICTCSDFRGLGPLLYTVLHFYCTLATAQSHPCLWSTETIRNYLILSFHTLLFLPLQSYTVNLPSTENCRRALPVHCIFYGTELRTIF